MKTVLVSIPENQTLNEKPKKTPRIKNIQHSIQHTEYDYIMMNNISKINNHTHKNCYMHETDDDIYNVFNMTNNKKKIFNLIDEVFEKTTLEYLSDNKDKEKGKDKEKEISYSIKSNDVIESIKYCFISIHKYIENEKKHLVCYDNSSNILDKIITNESTKPKQQRIDKILEIKRKEIK